MTDKANNSLSIETVSHPHSHAPQQNLPDTLSGLLSNAISDARSLDPACYEPRSRHWHTPDNCGMCAVCLAGCLIARTFRASPDQIIGPDHYDPSIRRKLRSVNYMRAGMWDFAFLMLHDRFPIRTRAYRLLSLPVPDHHDFIGWDSFRAHLLSLESLLPELREIDALDDSA